MAQGRPCQTGVGLTPHPGIGQTGGTVIIKVSIAFIQTELGNADLFGGQILGIRISIMPDGKWSTTPITIYHVIRATGGTTKTAVKDCSMLVNKNQWNAVACRVSQGVGLIVETSTSTIDGITAGVEADTLRLEMKTHR